MKHQPSTHEVQRNTTQVIVEDGCLIVTLPRFAIYGEHIGTLVDLLYEIGCDDQAKAIEAAAAEVES